MLKKYSDQLVTVNSSILEIANYILNANHIILKAFENCDVTILKDAKKLLATVPQRVLEIDNMIVKTLALFSPEATDLRLTVSFFKISNELQRASANTKGFISSFEVYCNSMDKQSIEKYALPLHKSTIQSLESVVDMMKCETDDVRENFKKVLAAEQKSDELYSIFQDYVFNLDKRVDEFPKYNKILNTLRKNEKIADRAVDMAYLILFARMGGAIGEAEA